MKQLLFSLILVTGVLQASGKNAAAGNASAAQAPADVKSAADVKGAAADINPWTPPMPDITPVTHQVAPLDPALVETLPIGIREWVSIFQKFEIEEANTDWYHPTITNYRTPMTDSELLILAAIPINAFLGLDKSQQKRCLDAVHKLKVKVLYDALRLAYEEREKERRGRVSSKLAFHRDVIDPYLLKKSAVPTTPYPAPRGPKIKKD